MLIPNLLWLSFWNRIILSAGGNSQLFANKSGTFVKRPLSDRWSVDSCENTFVGRVGLISDPH